MRLIGHLPDEPSARVFGDYLYVQGIENQVETEAAEGWGVWITDEDRISEAAGLLQAFRENPGDPRYTARRPEAARLRAEEEKSDQAYRKRVLDRRYLFRPLTAYGFGPVSFAFIVFSVAVAVLSKLGDNPEAIMSLFITNWHLNWQGISYYPHLPEIRSGQVWRLFTPILIHFGPVHLLFNMLWLRDLGSMIEARQNSMFLLLFILTTAAGSNLAQFYVAGAPNFGGMSGVLYALLGYIWIRGRFDPGSGLYLHPYTVIMMLAWLVACFAGLLGSVANIAHLAGLLMGMGWGFAASLKYR